MKPDAETIIAHALHVNDTGCRRAWGRLSDVERGGYTAAARALLNALRASGYSLIHGADHKFVKGD